MKKVLLIIAALWAAPLVAQTYTDCTVTVAATQVSVTCPIGTPPPVTPPPVTPPPVTPPPNTTPIVLGSTVTVNAGGANQGLCGFPGTVPVGSTGTVVSGPKTMDGNSCANVNFTGANAGDSGWTPTSALTVGSSATTPPPTSPPPTTPPPVTTACTKSLNPSGGTDNAQILAAVASTSGAVCLTGAGPFVIGANLDLPANANVQCPNNAVLTDTTTPYSQFSPMFTVNEANITINGCKIQMPNNYANAKKRVAAGQDYEYQHGISVQGGASNITISNNIFSGTAGDGLNIEGGSDITTSGNSTSANIRQGISVTGSVTNLSMSNDIAFDGPLSGIDIEPDGPGNLSISMNNEQTSGNAGGGTSFGLYALGPSNTVNITATKLQSTGDGGTGIGCVDDLGQDGGGGTADASGSVTVTDGTVTNSGGAATYCRHASVGWPMIFNVLTIANPNQKSADPLGVNAAIGVSIDGGASGPPGGVQWNGVTITGAKTCTDIMSGAKNTTVSGTCNGSALTFP
jgi:hypothetical protein